MKFNFFKKKPLQLFSPLTGVIVPLEEVPDPVFGQKMMGDGVAVMPTKGDVYSPVDGTVILVAATKHAVGIRAGDGTEILIHVGLETVALNGAGFTMAVSEGDKISAGQLLIRVDWEYIREHAKSIVTPIVITNSDNGKTSVTVTDETESLQGKTVILTVSAH